jgi:CHASE3 domain sensor protein
MLGSIDPTSPPEVVAHIIQVALAPVFLLTGIATLLNVFSNRLARVADRVDQLTNLIEDADKAKAMSLAAQLARLRRRSVALDVAVVLGALGAAATCASVLTLLIGALKNATVASVLFTTFALAVLCTLGAIAAFAAEMLMTSAGFRDEVARKRTHNA